MNRKLLTLISLAVVFAFIEGCSEKSKIVNNNEVSLIGTWELVSETKIEQGDTTFIPSPSDQRMIKIINPTHFAFLRHDLSKAQDSTALFVAGGGSYTLDGNRYTEHLEYCNFREWEGHSFNFQISIQGDTLVQSGVEKIESLGVDRIIVERYVRQLLTNED